MVVKSLQSNPRILSIVTLQPCAYNPIMNTSSNPEGAISVKRRLLRIGIFLLAILVLGAWLLNTPAGLLGKADAVGYAVCHRIDLRSFHIGERPISLCARCTGMFLSAFLALGFYAIFRPKYGRFPPKKVMLLFVLFVFVWAFDGINSYFHLIPGAPTLYQARNEYRLITGSLVGIALATMVYPVFSQTAWIEWKNERVLGSIKELLLILLLAAIMIALILNGNPLILYPLSLLSAAGVIVLLTIAYSLLMIPLFGKINKANKWRDLIEPLTAGFILAMIQIAVIDFLRFQLTGTWSGFHL